MMRQIFIFMIVCLAMMGVVSAATVSIDSYSKSCTQCTFDANGKMDQKCWQEIQDGAKTDLALAYPSMSFQYQFGGGCAPLDQCVAALQTCKSLHTSGNDQTDCYHNRLTHCFRSADKCAEAANKICAEGKSEEESGIKDVIEDMTSKEDKDEEEEEVPDMEDQVDFWLDCLFPGFILLSVLVGGVFSNRK
jgi:hypothetical protein